MKLGHNLNFWKFWKFAVSTDFSVSGGWTEEGKDIPWFHVDYRNIDNRARCLSMFLGDRVIMVWFSTEGWK